MTSQTIRNAFTVDLEEWFQGLTSTNSCVDRWTSLESRVVPTTERLLTLLDEYGVRATFFVLGYIADTYPDLIERLAADGHELAVHGYFHRFVSQMTPDEFTQELDRSIIALERITGELPLGHRAPYFSIDAATPWAFDRLCAAGLRYDSSIFPTRNMLYGYPDAPRFPYQIAGSALMEFPLSTVRVAGINVPIAGGFYLRTLPYPFVRWGIRRLNEQSQPAIMYVHPWELDLGQSYNRVTVRERVTHYHGRRHLEPKLRRLFTEFRFAPLCTIWRQQTEVGWSR